ncbi:inorganic pyrophosphatase, partial [Tanacetum coccineum]
VIADNVGDNVGDIVGNLGWDLTFLARMSNHLVQHLLLLPPVQDVADSCKTGAATNVIFGLTLGYKLSSFLFSP